MLRKLLGSALTRLLALAGLARAAQVEHERRLAERIRAGERARASREIAAASATLRGLRDRLRATQERLAVAHAECGRLRDELVPLRREETEAAQRTAALHRLRLAQLAIGVKAARHRGLTAAAAARVAHLASMSRDYSVVVERWRAGAVPAELRRVTAARLEWAVPVETSEDQSQQLLRDGRLSLDELAAVREFAVGGIMLDIGAHIGTTSIPRVLLGDFARVYAAEPGSETYFCLVGNTLQNGCEGRVLPHRVAIGGSAGPGRLRRADGDVEEVPCLTVDAWITRLRLAPGHIRYVRVVLREWNLDVDRGAAHLLAQPHVVWQLEIGPAVIEACGSRVERACARLAAHFTHFAELGGGPWRPASDAGALVAALAAERRGANLLLFNVRRNSRHARNLHT